MAEEQFKATTALFGEDAVERIKKRHDALKTLRTIKQPFQKDGAQRTNQFGGRENQGYIVRSPPTKMLRTSSTPPSEDAGNIRDLCMAPS